VVAVCVLSDFKAARSVVTTAWPRVQPKNPQTTVKDDQDLAQ
jgi:hypothetical protein